MRRIIECSLCLLVLAASGCDSQSGPATLNTDDQKASYAIGLQMGSQLAPADAHLDLKAYMAGIRDGMAGNEPAVPQEELQVALQALNATVQEEETARRAAAAETNTAEGQAFLAENATKDGVTVTESGLQYEILREGEGATPGETDRVTIHYKGTLIDGTQFDSSYDGGTPASFGVNGVIAGFSEGLKLMTVGSHYRFVIPPEIGYGPSGSGPVIGPNATLIFEVELMEIVQ